MKRRVVSFFLALALLLSLSVSALGATRATVVSSGDYRVGSSVYGPALNQAKLNEVADCVASFLNTYVDGAMTELERVAAACAYLVSTCDYAPDWSKNAANTAWGALIYKQAQCSGYARAFKALCDGMGVESYYVHADATAVNPSHQWNIVKVAGKYYHIDVQAFDSSGEWSASHFVLVSDATYATIGFVWPSTLPKCPESFGATPIGLSFTRPIAVADKPSAWAASAVNTANYIGLVPAGLQSGYKKPATRADICALAVSLIEGLGLTIPNYQSFPGFKDTADINVIKIASLGVVQGMGGDMFYPDGLLTREQAAVILRNLMELFSFDGSPEYAPPFADAATFADWSADAVTYVRSYGVMNGVDGNKFNPKGSYTREQCVVTMLRVLDAFGVSY